ncbi:Ribonuclease P protein subunit p25 [Phytophthora boehmeriae]|uniref:Ribonuclease P protein subunit p25 n=1 Tax=Phytophthora boehmeriae TaxID=109152 RepID=A0A8T1X181_9STRA|nr:Ribonuclease P protein subunit p25 [Phytophthora boehmeriae]
MDKYRRVEKPRREEQPTTVEPNEIRITQQGKVRSYISYANGLFLEKSERRVVLKAMGNAISKAVTVSEILKHRVQNLHQVTRLSSIETVDVYEPLEEGLDRIETKRHIPGISIELSLDQLDRDDPGYQSPIPTDQVTATSSSFHEGREFRKARGHGKRGGKKATDSVAATEATVPAAEGDSAQDNEAESGQQTPGEDDASTPTTRGKRGKGRGRGRTSSNGKNKKTREKNAAAEAEDDGGVDAEAVAEAVKQTTIHVRMSRMVEAAERGILVVDVGAVEDAVVELVEKPMDVKRQQHLLRLLLLINEFASRMLYLKSVIWISVMLDRSGKTPFLSEMESIAECLATLEAEEEKQKQKT